MGLLDKLVKGAGDTLFTGAAKIIQTLKADPTKTVEAEAELEKLRIANEATMAALANAAEEIQAKELETVNATMREEAKSAHWATWAWRPMIGFTFCLIIINNYVVLPYLKKYGLLPVVVPDDVWLSILTILGVASAGRSAAQWQKEKNK